MLDAQSNPQDDSLGTQVRTRPPWSCGGCDRRWSSLAQAHCTVCHEHFATVGVADKHNVFGPNREMTCLPPAEVKTAKGEPVYRQSDEAEGSVWRSYAQRVKQCDSTCHWRNDDDDCPLCTGKDPIGWCDDCRAYAEAISGEA